MHVQPRQQDRQQADPDADELGAQGDDGENFFEG